MVPCAERAYSISTLSPGRAGCRNLAALTLHEEKIFPPTARCSATLGQEQRARNDRVAGKMSGTGRVIWENMQSQFVHYPENLS